MRTFALFTLGLLAGCATSHGVLLTQLNPPPRALSTAALVSAPSNSTNMDQVIENELRANGLEVKPAAPAETRRSPDVDLLVAYVDHWWWDLAMYLVSVDVNIFDAQNGNLLAQGHWHDARYFHGFHDPAAAVHEIVPDMLSQIRNAPAGAK